jgi:hypothetical protein
MDHWQVFDDEK